ncbi:MAG TPA: fibronectin type III domain-containing protein, partial [Bacteroidia bacterium]|nr:fibronectin type III domain-containing protein [Bacteroidia bacterium]
MKKFNLVILFILSVCIVTAQNLKPVVQKVTDAYSHTSSVTVSNMFKVEPASEARLANVQQAISKGTFLRFDKTEAQQIITNAPAVLSLILPNSHGNPYHLKLVKTKFTTADFQVTAASTGKPVEVDMGLHYQGIIDGDNNSIAAISFYKEEVMGLISSPTLGNVVLGKIENNFRSEHILYNDRDLLAASNFECSTLADNGTYTPAELTPQNTNRSSMINCVRLFWEVDNSIYTGKGGMTPTVNYITGLFNQHQIIYTNDGIPVELSELFVWDVVDPYTGTTSSSFLSQFQNYRNVINGDLGHLVGYGGGGGVAAGFSGFCASNLNSSQCYSGINSTYNNVPTYSWSVMVVTHEQGHLMGSRHTHACVWNGNNTRIDSCGPAAGYTEGTCAGNIIPAGGGTIMSYCHLNGVGINLSLGFGPQPQAVILNKYNTATCLTSCIGTACMPSPSMNTSNITSVSASFNWTASTGATGYNIRYRIVGTSTWTTATSSSSPYIAIGLTSGANYEWQVQTVCNGSTSIFTISTNFTTPPLVCDPPINLSSTNITSSSATLSWSGIAGAVSYNIQYRIAGTTTWTNTTSASATVSISSLISNSNYEWQVQTVCAGGTTSSYSAPANFTTLVPPCTNSQNNFTTNITDASATLNWSSGVGSTAISYNLRYRVVGTTTWTTLSINAPASSTNISGLTSSTNYEWQIQTVCQGSSSSFSSSVPFTTLCTSFNATATANGPTTFCQGGSVDLVASPSSGGYSYLWRQNGIIISSATNLTYNAAAAGNYECIVNLNGCYDTTNVIAVTIGGNIQATITGSTTFCAGSGNILTANTGTGITYQWYRNTILQNGATSNTFNANSTGTYYVIENSSCGTAQSNSIVVTQINNPNATISYTTPLSFCAPGSVVLTSSTFSGVSYQWQKNSVDIAGATFQNYSATSNGTYRVRQTANGCFKYSPALSVTTATTVAATITANGPVTFCTGGSVVLSVNNAVPGYSYQWKNNNVNISGATQSSYTAAAAGSYTCTVTANCGTATSNAIVVSTGGITASVNPSGPVSICPGATAALSANTGNGYSYQWMLNGNNITGATNQSFNATSTGSYSVFISSPCGNATSAATVVNIANVTASISPSGSATICAGSAQTFTANTGYNFVYQWFRNGVVLAGATSSTYATSNYGSYTVRVTQSGICSATSAASVLSVTNNPTPTVTPQGPTAFCAGQSVVLQANSFAGVVFQWKKNGIDITGATSQNYTATTAGSYRVKQTANGCTKSSPTVTVTVNCREAGGNFEDATSSELKVMPNPFTNELIVTGMKFNAGDRADLIDVLGKTVLSYNIDLSTQNLKLKTQNIKPGVYFL